MHASVLNRQSVLVRSIAVSIWNFLFEDRDVAEGGAEALGVAEIHTWADLLLVLCLDD